MLEYCRFTGGFFAIKSIWFKIYQRRRMSSCCSTFSILSVRKSAKKDAPPIRLCKVLCCIEADLADGQQVYVTGHPIRLGCWEPEVAVLLSPTPEEATMWKAEIKVPCEANFKYSNFIKDGKMPSIMRWREGPDFSLSVPVTAKRKRKL